jgi:hypothetical protein
MANNLNLYNLSNNVNETKKIFRDDPDREKEAKPEPAPRPPSPITIDNGDGTATTML